MNTLSKDITRILETKGTNSLTLTQIKENVRYNPAARELVALIYAGELVLPLFKDGEHRSYLRVNSGGSSVKVSLIENNNLLSIGDVLDRMFQPEYYGEFSYKVITNYSQDPDFYWGNKKNFYKGLALTNPKVKKCVSCGEYSFTKVCDNCKDKVKLTKCAVCGVSITISKTTPGPLICHRCHNINTYNHFTPNSTNIIQKEAPLLVGVEDELVSYDLVTNLNELEDLISTINKETNYAWFVTDDGSVEDCLEWTSRASSYEKLVRNCNKLTSHYVGDANSEGGLHVTFEKKYLTNLRWAMLMQMITRNPLNIFKLSGRGDDGLSAYREYASVEALQELVDCADKLANYKRLVHGTTKFCAMNTTKSELVEFRFMSSVDDWRLSASVSTLVALVNYAKTSSISDGLRFYKYVNYVKDNTNNYPGAEKLIKERVS